MGHGHGRGAPADRSSNNRRRLMFVLLLTSTYLVAEVVGGILTKSLALLADAGHMLTDVGGLVLAMLAMKLADREASASKTYGYYRAEILAALANGVILIVVSLYVLYEAYERFRAPPEVKTTSMMLVAAIGLIVNVIGVMVLRAGSSESLNMKGAYFEVISDLLTSVGVIAGGAVMWGTGWYWVDPLVSAGIGLFIFPRTWKLVREATDVLLEGTPADVNMTQLRAAMQAVAGVADVHDLHVWSLSSGVNAMSAHVVVASPSIQDSVLQDVTRTIKTDFRVSHVTLQVESVPCGHEGLHS